MARTDAPTPYTEAQATRWLSFLARGMQRQGQTVFLIEQFLLDLCANYDRAIQLDANYALAYYDRGVAYFNKHDYDRALRDLTQAIKLDPKDEANYERYQDCQDGKADNREDGPQHHQLSLRSVAPSATSGSSLPASPPESE